MIGALTDARFAVRTLRRNPTFVILAVLCLGIGIGASTLTFTAVHHALLEPLGPVDPDGLVVVAETQASAPNQWAYASWANFLDWRDAVAEQAQMSALRPSAFVVGPDGAGRGVALHEHPALAAQPVGQADGVGHHLAVLTGGRAFGWVEIDGKRKRQRGYNIPLVITVRARRRA